MSDWKKNRDKYILELESQMKERILDLKKLEPKYKIGDKVMYLWDGVNNIKGEVGDVVYIFGASGYHYDIDGNGKSGLGVTSQDIPECWIMKLIKEHDKFYEKN